ncbi:hypothetical protein Sjap_020065 [Stephania japonica]|uniref:Uncharacterized protein n=1 Tax=Stephania japonica TaxID=461633 RepID=A0AAP0HZY3_9MAGN
MLPLETNDGDARQRWRSEAAMETRCGDGEARQRTSEATVKIENENLSMKSPVVGYGLSRKGLADDIPSDCCKRGDEPCCEFCGQRKY